MNRIKEFNYYLKEKKYIKTFKGGKMELGKLKKN